MMVRRTCSLLFSSLFALALQADSSIAELASETFRVPPHDYRYVPARIANWPATLICSAEVASGSPVRVEFVSKEELGKWVRGKPHSVLVALDDRRRSVFRQAVPDKGDYDILLVNHGDEPSQVRFQAVVQFAREPDVARYVSPVRRLTVVVLSALCFIVSVAWPAWKLRKAIGRG